MAKAGLAECDQRRIDRLVRAALRPKRDPARGRHEQETRILVASVIQAIETASDERIVERPDRKQPLSEQVARQAERAQHQEKIGFRDPELDMLTLVCRCPFLRAGNLCGGEDVLDLASFEQPALVDPRSEIGRHGDVGRGGDDAAGKLAFAARQVEHDLAERRLSRLLGPGWRFDRRNFDLPERAFALLAPDPRAVDQCLDRRQRVGADARERLPLVPRRNPHRIAHRLRLGRVHQPRMIVLVPRERQPETLDRIGQEQGRDIVLRGVEGVDQGLHAMPAERGHQPRQRFVVVSGDQLERGLVAGEIMRQPRPPCRPALVGQRGEIGVGALVDPALDRLAPGPGEGLALQPAVLERDHAPSAARENLVEILEHAVGRGRVEALAVIVDDPPAIADVVLVALDQALVDIALVQFGIADQRHEPPAVGLGHLAVRGEIILDQAGEGGDRHPKPDRPGREIDRDSVLGPARIALHPAEAAEVLQLLEALRPHQIMNRVEQGPGMRLDRDPVVGAERAEIKRGHDRAHRRAARLVPADLQPVAGFAQVIGIVDRPRRQKAQFVVEDREGVEIGTGHRSALANARCQARVAGYVGLRTYGN